MNTSTARSTTQLASVIGIVVWTTACAGAIHRVDTPGQPTPLRALWVEPDDLEQRDLFYGPGGPALVPDRIGFEMLSRDTTGASGGYDVRDPSGREWSVKLGIEAQPEIVVSRVLWALGYHQDPMYYVDAWTFADGKGPVDAQPAGRFRLKSDRLDSVANWSWRENPFIGTRAFGGLIVVNILLNNWDWKTNNNHVYNVYDESGAVVGRRYVVRDLGAALGRTTYPMILQWSHMRGITQGTKNDIDGFEQQHLLRDVDDEHVSFDYVGIHGDLLDLVTRGDVVWACRLLSRLSEQQWNDVFRAAGYDPSTAERFRVHIASKIREGLALGTEAQNSTSTAATSAEIRQ